METDAGDWTDRSFADVRAEAPELFDAFAAAEPGFAFPGGESFAEQERAGRGRARGHRARRPARARRMPRDGDPRGALPPWRAGTARCSSACRTRRSCRSTPARPSRRTWAAARRRCRARRSRTLDPQEAAQRAPRRRRRPQPRIAQPVLAWAKSTSGSSSRYRRPSAVAVRRPAWTTRPSASTRPIAGPDARADSGPAGQSSCSRRRRRGWCAPRSPCRSPAASRRCRRAPSRAGCTSTRPARSRTPPAPGRPR